MIVHKLSFMSSLKGVTLFDVFPKFMQCNSFFPIIIIEDYLKIFFSRPSSNLREVVASFSSLLDTKRGSCVFLTFDVAVLRS